MKKTGLFVVALFLSFSAHGAVSPSTSQGAGSRHEAIDLGKTEIEGQIRRPSTLIVESQEETRRALGGLALEEFKKLERRTLEEAKKEGQSK